jgi:hypothetical protein
MRFDLIRTWYIVYDTSKIIYTKQFSDNPKVIELECNTKGVCGHPQINYAINKITDGYVYVLDDDNIMHPEFWKIAPHFDGEHVYTVDQLREPNRRVLLGNNISIGNIDTAQFIVPAKLIGDIRWPEQARCGDYAFISKINKKHPTKFRYIRGVFSYWNYLAKKVK